MNFLPFLFICTSTVAVADVDITSFVTDSTQLQQLPQKMKVAFNTQIPLSEHSSHFSIMEDHSLRLNEGDRGTYGGPVTIFQVYNVFSEKGWRWIVQDSKTVDIARDLPTFLNSRIKVIFRKPLPNDLIISNKTQVLSMRRDLFTGNYLYSQPCLDPENRKKTCGNYYYVSVMRFITPDHPIIESIDVNFTGRIPNENYPRPTVGDFKKATNGLLSLTVSEVLPMPSDE